MKNKLFKPLQKAIDMKKIEYLGYKKEHYEIKYVDQNGFPAYSYSSPLYFKDCQNLSKGVYFSNYFNWMGKIRESAMMPILKNISDDLNTGKIGMVTNSSSVNIVGDATTGDVVESRMGLMNIVNESTLDIFFEWRKVLENHETEIIAYGEMRVSWVLILDHGIVAAEPFPKYYMDFINGLKADDSLYPYEHQIDNELHSSLTKGKNLYSAPLSPRRGKVLAEEIIYTTLEDSNSVGNIYFSHYSRWQGVIRDKFFYAINSEYFKDIGIKGELLATNISVEHLREIMPFDTVMVTMRIVELWENAMELSFEYHKIDGDQKIKLAFGVQTVYWVKKESQNSYTSYSLPTEFTKTIQKVI